ncbi:T-cell surface glycoprotein CD5 [Sminthopsis crassicaudata]|uniref:T-cell surface glycoprotein CD5 n=1 Tax=Sminthopsis crassicaudata TaxID=9301 RepID=UPI003D69E13B
MGLCRSPPTLLYLLGTLVSSCHGGPQQTPSGPSKDIINPGSPCQVQLEVKLNHTTSVFCLKEQKEQELTELHSKLGPLRTPKEMACSFFSPSVLDPAINVSSTKLKVDCHEAVTKVSLPTQRPIVTSPEPTGPSRFLLVEGKERLRCAGVVELYRGRIGGSICFDSKTWTDALGDKICRELNCGTFLELLDQPAEKPDWGNSEGLKPLPILWEVGNQNGTSLDQVFTKQKSCRQNKTISLVCSDFQPKVKSRLKGGSNPCKGIVEVYFEGQWKALCGKRKNWEEVCHEQHCGSLISEEDVFQKSTSATSSMLHCKYGNLSRCYTFLPGDRLCKGTMIECQDLNAAGPGAGTVMSIILTFILVAILLVTCGPVAYKKLEKKFRQKKQRQWIGPTGVNQNVSFHRNHTVTIRSQVENPGASNVENEYSQPPRHSRLSAYPALEGALDRTSHPPDNSSDSDYDLHGAQRL